MLLIHTGQLTGRTRKDVVSVVDHDRQAGTWTIAPPPGPAARWRQDLARQPQATVQYGRVHHPVVARLLDAGEAGEFMTRYGRLRPRAARRVCAERGFPADGDHALRHAGKRMTLVRLEAVRPDAGPAVLHRRPTSPF